jgi:hypothetical protein
MASDHYASPTSSVHSISRRFGATGKLYACLKHALIGNVQRQKKHFVIYIAGHGVFTPNFPSLLGCVQTFARTHTHAHTHTHARTHTRTHIAYIAYICKHKLTYTLLTHVHVYSKILNISIIELFIK